MATTSEVANDRPKHTLAQLYETVDIIVADDDNKNMKFFRILTQKYAPGFAAAFSHPNVTSVTIRNVDYNTLTNFRDWLTTCWTIDKYTENNIWREFHDGRSHFEPDWDLLAADSIRVDMQPIYWYGGGITDAMSAVDLWIFGDMYEIALLRQDAIDRLAWFFDYERITFGDGLSSCQFLGHDTIMRAYRRTRPDSLLRKILAAGFCQIFLCEETPELVKPDDLKDMPDGFEVDVAEFYARFIRTMITRQNSGYTLNRCDYHEHASDEERGKCTSRVDQWRPPPKGLFGRPPTLKKRKIRP
ncbi:hypothetical protein N0V90_007979 [Kalmusia sp. IMI 367209]|nr:hypothetical protein N0V90_007979 [Kalmusia sp. IMI 367209]